MPLISEANITAQTPPTVSEKKPLKSL